MKRALPSLLLLLLLLLGAAPIFGLDQSESAFGISLYNQGRLREAKEVLEGVLNQGRAGTLEMVVLGMTYTKLGEHEQAERILMRAKEREPFNSLVHIGLGMLEFTLQEYDSAYQYFDLAYRIEPDSKQARDGMVASLVNRAILLYREGEADRAAAHLEEALRLQPRNPALIGLLIQVRRDQGWSTGLTELYRRLVEVQPENAQAFAELGVLLEGQGMPEAAHLGLARSLESLGRVEEARI